MIQESCPFLKFMKCKFHKSHSLFKSSTSLLIALLDVATDIDSHNNTKDHNQYKFHGTLSDHAQVLV